MESGSIEKQRTGSGANEIKLVLTDEAELAGLAMKREMEQKTGDPLQLTAEQRPIVTEKVNGIDPETTTAPL